MSSTSFRQGFSWQASFFKGLVKNKKSLIAKRSLVLSFE
jgi:hypothetical protein